MAPGDTSNSRLIIDDDVRLCRLIPGYGPEVETRRAVGTAVDPGSAWVVLRRSSVSSIRVPQGSVRKTDLILSSGISVGPDSKVNALAGSRQLSRFLTSNPI